MKKSWIGLGLIAAAILLVPAGPITLASATEVTTESSMMVCCIGCSLICALMAIIIGVAFGLWSSAVSAMIYGILTLCTAVVDLPVMCCSICLSGTTGIITLVFDAINGIIRGVAALSAV